MNTKTIGMGLLILGLTSWLHCVGCEGNTAAERFFKTGKGRFLQPDKPILAPETAQLNWIIQSMGELDKTDELYPDATRPRPEDWIYADTDYIIGPTDVLSISIQDLYYEGVETTLQREVSNSGYVDLPLLRDRIQAEGLSAMELTRAIEQAYSPAVIKTPPIVTVTLLMRRKQMFSVLGSVMRPGTYQLSRPDMRVLEALALSGGVSQPNIEYIYVIRSAPPLRKSEQEALQEAVEQKVPARPAAPAPSATPADRKTQLKDIGDLMKESVTHSTRPESPEAAPAEMCQYSEASSETVAVGTWTPMSEVLEAASGTGGLKTKTPPTSAPPNKTLRWVYRNGEWVQEEVKPEASAPPEAPPVAPAAPPAPKPQAAPRPVKPSSPPVRKPASPSGPDKRLLPTVPPERIEREPSEEEETDPFGWAKAEKKDQVRIIALNLKLLEQGDYRQNIVIRENDIIRIPSLEIGEWFIMGEVLRPGAYSLTGRKVTIKMALASAGNLGPLAWPENSVLIRRIGKNQEQMIPINIESILRGTEADIYLKPNDIIAVGTHWSTSFLAVMRNAFRMSYGFGFIYDRNFADPLLVYPNSRRFKGW